MNAAFFDYDPECGAYRYIVLTAANPVLETMAGGEHEEGWSRTYTRWELDNDVVICTTDNDGRDCDGRCSSRYVQSCPVGELANREPFAHDGEPVPPFKLPNWQERKRSQRDYSAEAAGY